MSSLSIWWNEEVLFSFSFGVSFFSIHRTIDFLVRTHFQTIDVCSTMPESCSLNFPIRSRIVRIRSQCSIFDFQFSIWYLFSFIYISCFVQCHHFHQSKIQFKKAYMYMQYSIHSQWSGWQNDCAITKRSPYLSFTSGSHSFVARFVFFISLQPVVGCIQFSIYNLQCSNRLSTDDEIRFHSKAGVEL